MSGFAKRVLAFALLAAVLFIVIHPVLDLPDSTLRSKSVAYTVFYAMTIAFFSAETFFAAIAGSAPRFIAFEPEDASRSTLSALRC